jgi:copper(I)-binding protein
LLAAGGCSQATGGDGLEVIDARLRALIPGQDMTAGYFTLNNRGRAPITVVGAESDAARSIEMHTTVQDGEVVRMRRLQEVVVPPGEAVRFEPGGRHLMLFGVSSLHDATEVVLLRKDGKRVVVSFETIPLGEE